MVMIYVSPLVVLMTVNKSMGPGMAMMGANVHLSRQVVILVMITIVNSKDMREDVVLQVNVLLANPSKPIKHALNLSLIFVLVEAKRVVKLTG
jgi:hypothetical protein